jgi:hypothetical protein
VRSEDAEVQFDATDAGIRFSHGGVPRSSPRHPA